MILEAVSDDWRMSCIRDYWGCLRERLPDNQEFPEDEGKAKLAIFLASQRKSALRSEFWGSTDDAFRLDFQQRHLNLNHPVYSGLKSF
jgi:hypothetical protein